MGFHCLLVRTALRLCPPVATNSRASNKDTVLPRGGGPDGKQPILVPKGTSVRWSLYSMHRDKNIYGSDADEFRPERWDSNLRVGYDIHTPLSSPYSYPHVILSWPARDKLVFWTFIHDPPLTTFHAPQVGIHPLPWWAAYLPWSAVCPHSDRIHALPCFPTVQGNRG